MRGERGREVRGKKRGWVRRRKIIEEIATIHVGRNSISVLKFLMVAHR